MCRQMRRSKKKKPHRDFCSAQTPLTARGVAGRDGAERHARPAAAARKALAFLSTDFKPFQSRGETLCKKFPRQTERQAWLQPA